MHEAFDSNLQFMTRIAEIQSVAPGAANSLDLLAQNVANLSREFNIPLAQVAEAQYQAISNQFASTAQQSDLLTAAFKLSKVAVMDAGQAVNLLAGTMNAYHMQSSQAEEVAAKFFGTIQVGRVRGEELASVLGPRDGRVERVGRGPGRAERHDGHADHFRREAGRGRHRAALRHDGAYQALRGLDEGTAAVGLRVRPRR